MNTKLFILIGLLFAGIARAGTHQVADPLQPLLKGFTEPQRQQVLRAWNAAPGEAERQALQGELRDLNAKTKFHFRDLLPGGRTRLDADQTVLVGFVAGVFLPVAIAVAKEVALTSALTPLAVGAALVGPIALVAGGVYVAVKLQQKARLAAAARENFLKQLGTPPAAMASAPSLLGVCSIPNMSTLSARATAP